MVLPHQTAFIHDKYHISDPKAANLTLYQHNKSIGVTEMAKLASLLHTHTHTHTHARTHMHTHLQIPAKHTVYHFITVTDIIEATVTDLCLPTILLLVSSLPVHHVPFVLTFILPLLHHPVAST